MTLSFCFPFFFKLYVCFKSDSTYDKICQFTSVNTHAMALGRSYKIFSIDKNDDLLSSRVQNKKKCPKLRENSKFSWDLSNSYTYVLVYVAPFDVGDFRIYAEAKFIYQFTCTLLAHMRFAFNFKNKLKSDKITDLLTKNSNLECLIIGIFAEKFHHVLTMAHKSCWYLWRRIKRWMYFMDCLAMSYGYPEQTRWFAHREKTILNS